MVLCVGAVIMRADDVRHNRFLMRLMTRKYSENLALGNSWLSISYRVPHCGIKRGGGGGGSIEEPDRVEVKLNRSS